MSTFESNSALKKGVEEFSKNIEELSSNFIKGMGNQILNTINLNAKPVIIFAN